MNHSAIILDDLLNGVYKELLNRPFNIPTSRGNTSEIIGSHLTLQNPRARLSRTEVKGTIFSALGELLWYLSGKDELDFIKYYIPQYTKESSNGKTVHGAYGPRLFNANGNINQFDNIIALLQNKPTTRRAAVQIFEASDLVENYIEIPCTCTLQFLNRDGVLHMLVFMRSNDAYAGLPHDVFSFTMLQEIIARILNIEIGTYTHMVGSLHLYETDKLNVEDYLKEGIQSTKKNMPPIPIGDPRPSIKKLLHIEEAIRLNTVIEIKDYQLEPYWQDLAYLLKFFNLYKKKDLSSIDEIRKNLDSRIYET